MNCRIVLFAALLAWAPSYAQTANSDGELYPEYELRVPLRVQGYEKLKAELFDLVREGSVRRDIYFNIYHGGTFVFRREGRAKPLKIRIKAYKEDDYVWQVTRRNSRELIVAQDLPITATKMESYAVDLKRKNGRAIITAAEEFLWALHKDAANSATILEEMHQTLDPLGDLAGFNWFGRHLEGGGLLVPAYINSKERKKMPLVLEGIAVVLQLRRNIYWLSKSIGHPFYELEVEFQNVPDEESFKRGAEALATYLKSHGLLSEHIDDSVFDHCSLPLRKLNEHPILRRR